MDFRAYVEQKRKEVHKEIIFDICMIVNNCAECHNDETRRTECCPLNRVELHKVFCFNPIENSIDLYRGNELVESFPEGVLNGMIIEVEE